MKRSILTLAVLALLLGSIGQAKAATVGITSRASLGGNDFVDWGQLGPTFTVVPNPFTATSNGGLTLNVSQAGASDFERRDQDNGWAGNFAPGDQLLWTSGSNGPVTMAYGLNTDVSAIGAQIQADAYGPFTATITAFDAANNVLGSFTEIGNSSGDGDNSAIFLGIRSDTNNIHSITYSVSSALGEDFGINRLDFDASPSAAPEPSSLALFGLTTVAFAGYTRWRRRNQLATA